MKEAVARFVSHRRTLSPPSHVTAVFGELAGDDDALDTLLTKLRVPQYSGRQILIVVRAAETLLDEAVDANGFGLRGIES